MSNHLIEIFEDEKLVENVKRRLPYLFQLAELAEKDILKHQNYELIREVLIK
ncbi:MAG TPA: hypothetical protein P5268_08390 [Candidatus Marinimicrobia bacterium]|nr:hypothetical protein [Candidatus Neomarinimicrobiota bacterium]HRU93032.1 hypothetical protein [Candidatus Neomarinimicrobiota bacterium]